MNITVNKFNGIVPKVEPRLLSSEYAQVSTNVNYDSGSLVPVNEFKFIELPPIDIDAKSIFKYTVAPAEDRWLYFTSEVSAVKDPIYCYPDNRVVVSGMGAPRVFDTTLLDTSNTVTESNSILLGLPVADAPIIAVAALGDGYFESRAYTVQYDREWASDYKIDQGPYSAPAETATGALFVDVTTNGTVTISNINDAPAGYGITHITINRSSSTVQNASIHFLTTFNIADAKAGTVAGVTWNSGTATFTVQDNVPTYDLGQSCVNADYIAPPATLKGIISINNGILAGYDGNSVYFCEPYQCHAWPEQYRVSIGQPVVGLGSFGDMVVVCTNAEPYIISMSDPAAAVAFPIKDFAPCISAAGIVSYRDSVVYPSDAGFIRVDRSGVVNLTQELADIKDMKNFNLGNVRAAGLGYYYYVLFTTDSGQRKMLTFNIQNAAQGFGICDSNILCIYSDFESASLCAVYRTSLGEVRLGYYDSGDSSLVYSWKSKVFSLADASVNVSAARIHFDSSLVGEYSDEATYEELDYSINTWAYNDGPINGNLVSDNSADYIMFSLYVDNAHVFTKKVYSTKPFRLPAGIVGRDIEIALVGAIPVYSVDIASSMTELTGA